MLHDVKPYLTAPSSQGRTMGKGACISEKCRQTARAECEANVKVCKRVKVAAQPDCALMASVDPQGEACAAPAFSALSCDLGFLVGRRTFIEWHAGYRHVFTLLGV